MPGKKVRRASIIGERGVAMIHTIVLEMGCLWYPSGGLEAGIDGTIELRDPVTEEATNCVVLVQSKATANPWPNETEESFDFRCRARDLDYWLSGNVPVVLIVSRPDSREAYWAIVRERFPTSSSRTSLTVHFNKRTDRFNASCYAALRQLAEPRHAGLYMAPPPRDEVLYSNLLPLVRMPAHAYSAVTPHRSAREVNDSLRALDARRGDAWYLARGRIVSVYDLSITPWNEICDSGTLERIDVADWARAQDRDQRRELVWLLNGCLRDLFWRHHVRWHRECNVYYFRLTVPGQSRLFVYASLKHRTQRDVVKAYASRQDPERVSHYRHAACAANFRCYDGRWHLELNPTYLFTKDGMALSSFHAEWLAGKKGMETNAAVLGAVVMWAALLSQPPDLLNQALPNLGFGPLLSLETDAGLDEESWLARGGSDPRVESEVDPEQLALFDP